MSEMILGYRALAIQSNTTGRAKLLGRRLLLDTA